MVGADVATGGIIAAIAAGIAVLVSLRSGSRVVLAASGARPADPQAYFQLHNLVEALAIGDGLPKPAVYVIDDPSPNAFATGTSPNRAAITVTSGLLQEMNREELEGVLSHEMSHIKNLDVRLLLVVSTLIGLAGLAASILWRSTVFTRPRGRNGGQIVHRAAGRQRPVGDRGRVRRAARPPRPFALRRKSLADVSGVELTRNPAGLLSALQKLEANDRPFAKFNHATAAMCIDDPLQHHEAWFHRLFDTHPPLEERIAVLQRIAYGQSV